jgi:galactose mutarotase-like enzyme
VPGIGLHSDELFLSVFPDAGGKILELVHKPTGFNLLWQNPRVALSATYAGAAFDDVWCGGWDELFPTDPPCSLDGNTYHDHGDLWIGPWEWSVEEDDREKATLSMRRFSVSLPCLMEKRVSLRRDANVVTFRHRLSNLGTQPVSFVWNLHVAHAVGPGSRLHLPAERLGVQPPYYGRAGEGVGELSWPLHAEAEGAHHDLSRVPGPETGLTEFFFARDLREGWCVVTHPSVGIGLELAFEREVFPTVWLFGVYGGWRGHNFLLTEPCTSTPGSLADSVANGSAATLGPGDSLGTAVVATVLSDVDPHADAERRPNAAPVRGKSSS